MVLIWCFCFGDVFAYVALFVCMNSSPFVIGGLSSCSALYWAMTPHPHRRFPVSKFRLLFEILSVYNLMLVVVPPSRDERFIQGRYNVLRVRSSLLCSGTSNHWATSCHMRDFFFEFSGMHGMFIYY